jgi:hypothetical protein
MFKKYGDCEILHVYKEAVEKEEEKKKKSKKEEEVKEEDAN